MGFEGDILSVSVSNLDKTLAYFDFTDPTVIDGSKVKAKVGLGGTLVGKPIQLTKLAKR
jgi:hypothetical protein